MTTNTNNASTNDSTIDSDPYTINVTVHCEGSRKVCRSYAAFATKWLQRVFPGADVDVDYSRDNGRDDIETYDRDICASPALASCVRAELVLAQKRFFDTY